MTQKQLDELKAHLEANKNIMELGFNAARELMIREMLQTEEVRLRKLFQFEAVKDAIINNVTKDIPVEEETENPEITNEDPQSVKLSK